MSGITIKNYGKKTQGFLMKLDQICVKLYGNKSKHSLPAGNGAGW